MQKLDRYVALLADWQTRMNLVGSSTLPDVWNRHIRDSAQLIALAPAGAKRWLDIGAGAGFPGLVVATMTESQVVLAESIAKKCRFLATVAGDLELGTKAIIENKRVDQVHPFDADIITARACASLVQLFDWGHRFAAKSTTWLLPKGASVESELAEAANRFSFDFELVQSQTDERGRIVVARGVKRR